MPQLYLIAAAVVALVSGLAGWTVAGWRCDAARLASVARAVDQAEALAAQDREVLTAGAAQAVRTETVFRTLDREVVRYVQTPAADRPCLDADGLRLWAAANADDWSLAAAPPRHSLSGFAGPSLRAGGRPVGQPRDDDAGLSHLPGSAQNLVGVGPE